MVGYTNEAIKYIKKASIPKGIVNSVFDALLKVAKTKNIDIFDIKELVGNYNKK